MKITWANDLLRISSSNLPGGELQVWYLEAFCRSGSSDRDWNETIIPHKTELVSADKDGQRLRLRTLVQPSVEVEHDIRAGKDEVEFRLTFHNRGKEFVDVQWFQPCIRVGPFSGRNQTNYLENCFIFTKEGLVALNQTRRTEAARYRGGQVYVPRGINLNDVNPRPISLDIPAYGLIGCISGDGHFVVATAWDKTQELFQGVLTCIHSDPRVGGLKPGETKKLRGKIYFSVNDAKELLKRYRRDFVAK